MHLDFISLVCLHLSLVHHFILSTLRVLGTFPSKCLGQPSRRHRELAKVHGKCNRTEQEDKSEEEIGGEGRDDISLDGCFDNFFSLVEDGHNDVRYNRDFVVLLSNTKVSVSSDSMNNA
jgi:hypothetical protein